jgi:spore coat protein U-like protein
MRFVALMTSFVWMTGTANAAATCNVSTSGVAFGNYDPISAQNRDTTGTISVTCSGVVADNVNYSISLTPGGGNYANRTQSAGTATINYNLYVDVGRMIVLGDGTSGTEVVSDSYVLSASPTTRQYTVYGRIPGGQTQAVVGAYCDSLLVTLTY